MNIADFWRSKLNGSVATKASKLGGWISDATAPAGFVEPTLKLLEGDPATARIFIIAAPGAVGKTSYAKALAAATQSVVVDLAQTSPLGGNFFKGGLSNAFGAAALMEVEAGKIALIVDALDEAQMSAGRQGYEAGLADLAQITVVDGALPAVLLGRAIAAEDAYLHLAGHGFEVCLLEIQFFDDAQARRYIDGKLPLIAARHPQLAAAYANHAQTYRDLAHKVRARLIEAAGCEQERFSGYAPVLDAICEFTLEVENLNPKSKLERLNATSQIALVRDIITAILLREQNKLQAQFKSYYPDVAETVFAGLYSSDEQLGRIASTLFGTKSPQLLALQSDEHRTTYLEMVEGFAPQHPFVSSAGAANPIFAAYVVAWALKHSAEADVAREAVLKQPNLMSAIFFELYDGEIQAEEPFVPLADVGILYQALNSRITLGQRVQLEITGQENDDEIEVRFEILERSDPETGEAPQGTTWGPYITTSQDILDLRSPFSNVYVDAPIFIQLGDGDVQEIGAPTELNVAWLGISAKQVLVIGGGSDGPQETQNVSLIAADAECGGVQNVSVNEATLLVSWDGAKVHPWNNYAWEVVPASDDNVDFMRRRLRNVLTAFRSHSKGALRRLAAKIDHSRMIKDARGKALLEKLIADKILAHVQSGKFYELDSDIMGRTLFVSYHDLSQSKFPPELDSYLREILTNIK